MGYKAAMVRTPHYYKSLLNNTDAQMLYFRSVADQAKIPLMIYNWPQATGIDIPPKRWRAFRAPQHHRDQGKLGQHREGHADDPGGEAGIPGAGGLRADAVRRRAQWARWARCWRIANAAPYSTIAIWEAYRTRESRPPAGLAEPDRPRGRSW